MSAEVAEVLVELPDGTQVRHPAETTPMDIAMGISEGLARSVIAAEVSGRIVDADRPLGELAESDSPLSLKLLTSRDRESLDVLRHSAAHVMARAVMRLYKGVSLAFGPTTDGGFYYDFDIPEMLSEEDFPKIEAEIKKIIKDKEPFERFSLSRGEARKLLDDLDQDLKVEHIDTGLSDQESVSFYRQGEFIDLCRGPHIPDAGKIKAIKMMSVAGSHWKGDVSGRSLQRLYGTAFFDKKELAAYLEQIEEAKRRDHRVLGKQHGLFTISPEVGQGLCLWLPKGGASSRGVGRLFAKRAAVAWLRSGLQPAYRACRNVRDQWSLSVLPRQPIPATLWARSRRNVGRLESTARGRNLVEGR